MTAKSTQNVQMCITNGTANTANDLSPTAISAGASGKGIVVTAASGSVQLGDVVKFPQDIGFTNIAGKAYAVTKLNGATGFEIGNVTLGTGTLKAGSKVSHWATGDIQCLCLSEFSVTVPTPATIDTSTYCGPGSIPSAKTDAGSASAAGYLDVADLGYLAILAASEDGVERILRVKLGTDNGYLVMPVTIAGLGITLPLDGAQGYNFTFTFGAKPVHVF